MTIIATLKPVENASAALAHAIASIPLSKLVPWEGNVRKTGAADGLDDLTASIAAHGVLQSLVVRKTNRGKYAIVAGRRRFLALSALAEGGTIAGDAPIPCRVIPGSADATEISLTENVIRAPMHPADQFEAFRDLIDGGASVADIAARFAISESAVRQRLKLGRVSENVLAAYRAGDLTLEQVQAFAITDDHAAQERVLNELPHRSEHPDDIRAALTQDEISARDKRARFVTLAAYEEAGGSVRRDLFAQGEDGVFLLDADLLDRLTLEKLQQEAEAVKAEGWKWVEAVCELDTQAQGDFRKRAPSRMPLSDEAQAEEKGLSEEYSTLYESYEEPDEETSERLDAIEARIEELNETAYGYTPDVLAIAGAIVTIRSNGELQVVRGLVRGEDEPEAEEDAPEPKARPEYSAALVASLTEAKSAGLSAALAQQPAIALAAVVHVLASRVFHRHHNDSSLQLSVTVTRLREPSRGTSELDAAHERWAERLPEYDAELWQWCLSQQQDTLLELLAYCAARSLDAVEGKQHGSRHGRIDHANALALALKFDMADWFTPTAENFFSRVTRTTIANALTEAKGTPAKRSWNKLTKAAFAALAAREVLGTRWLPQPLRLSA
jgi:ParB family chromosome partitioning protein